MDELVDPEHGESYQDVLLSLTVNNPLVMQYPLKVEYQQSFMRELVKQVNAYPKITLFIMAFLQYC